MAKTIIALYDDFESAHDAVQALVDAGFQRDDISLMTNDAKGEHLDYTATDVGDTTGSGMAVGAGIGAAVGGIGGLLVGLGTLVIPGIGPVLAAGPLAAALAGAGIGAVAGGIIGALTNLGVPEEQAGIYAEGVRRGGTLVAVNAADDQADQAIDILEGFGPVDIDRRAEEWKHTGWTGYDIHAQPYSAEQITSERQRYATEAAAGTDIGREVKAGEETRVPVVEEQVKVGKRDVERGGVRIHTYMKETPVEETVHLREEQVKVERKPVDRPAQPEDLEAFEEGTIEVTEHSEEPVVSKESRVVEEVVVGKEVKEREQAVREKARRREVEVEEVGAGPEKHD